MTRYAPGYRKIFVEHNGTGPWRCSYLECDKLVYEFGKRSTQGAIHHKDEDKHNNDPDNLEIMHFGCHRRHHMIARDVTATTRVNMSKAQKQRVAPRNWKHSDDVKKRIGESNSRTKRIKKHRLMIARSRNLKLDELELGHRVAISSDESHEIAYRIGEALGIAREDVPVRWRRSFFKGSDDVNV